MSGLGGVIFWDGRPAPEVLAAAIMNPIRHRGPDGMRWEIRGPAALGQACLALRRGDARRCGPVWSPDGSRAVVADALLHNRDDLSRRLGEGWWDAAPSDTTLVLAAYERWGDAAVELLEGEFAFVIWEPGRRRAFAARDAFGVQPLVYHWSRECFVFGSEPKQLRRSGLVHSTPDDETVAEHLLFRFGPSERTFLRGVSRVQAGHTVVADAAGAIQRRWWAPSPDATSVPSDPADIHATFRALLKDSVRRRVNVEVPVASHLSGGVDSASIVLLAAELFRSGELLCPAFSTVSQVYPGLECDETDAIATVSARVPFENRRVSPLEESLAEGLEHEIRDLDSPFAFIQRGAANAEARVMGTVGSRALLTGLGGDELLEEWPYFYDLAAHGRVLRLLRDAWAFRDASSWGFLEILKDSLRASIPTPGMRAIRRRFRKPPRPPAWINPNFATAGEVLSRPAPTPAATFSSRLQRQVLANLTSPLLGRTLETLEARGATRGFTIRYPFLDRPLAEFVLAIPYDARCPGDTRKKLLRRSMACDLPDEVMFRRRKVVFDSYVRRVIAENLASLEAMLFGAGRWLSEPYVPEAAARALFSPGHPERSVVAPAFWRVATLEVWLRTVLVT